MAKASQTWILTGTRFAWIHLIAAGAITEKWRFDTVQKSTAKFPKTGTDTGGEKINILFFDGVTMQGPKETLILSLTELNGASEKDITPIDASSDATNKCIINITVNAAPLESNSMSAFLADLVANKDALFFVTIGTGMSYEARNTTKKPEGYVHCICKLNNDIEANFDANHNPLTLEFVSYKNPVVDPLTAGDLTPVTPTLCTEMTWKLGGTDKDVAGIIPPTLSTPNETILFTGAPVIIPAITYS